MITKTAKIGVKWERVGLDKEELEEAMKKLLNHNTKELNRISEYILHNNIDDSKKEIVFKALSEKQLTSSFTVIANALDEKLFRLRNNENKRFTPNVQSTIKKEVEDGLKKKDTPEGKSAIDEAFDKTSVNNE